MRIDKAIFTSYLRLSYDFIDMKSVNKFFEKGILYLQGKILVVYGAFYAVCSTPVEAEIRPAKKLGLEQVVKKVRASRGKKEMFKPVFDSAIAV